MINFIKYLKVIIKIIFYYEEIVKKKINLIIPTSDEGIISVENKNYFAKFGTTIACINYDKLKVLNDKSKTYTKLNEFNIPTAEWAVIKNKEELKKYYFILKSMEGSN